MSKTLKKVGVVLGAVALVATGIGAIAGGAILGVSFATIGAVAGVAAGLANVGSQALAKPPPARGSLSQVLIQTDAPRPYPMGEIHFAGVLRHRAGYGGTVDGVKNPYLFDVVVYSGVGPVESITPRVDFAAVPAWYSGYLNTDSQLGANPESSALTATWGSPTGWGAAYKLSGHAAIAWNLKFDKKGEKFASGFPLTGALIEGVTAYDPRLDSTFPGGSGAHRIDDEATWEYSANAALHALAYAYGRYANGVRVMGIGLPADGIDIAAVAAWANVCDANAWTIGGVAFEPGDKWANLKDICAAGGAEPVFAGAVLGFRYDAPVVALDTVTEADVLDSMAVTFQQSYRDRLNTIIPKYRSPGHNWEMVDADPVQAAEYLAEDGDERREEWPFNFVTDVDQVTQLAAYKLVNSREFHPITLHGMPRLRAYRPGDCLYLDLPRLGLATDAVILERKLDPATMTVELTLIGETAAKHAYALGLTGTAPEPPELGQDAQERDETSANSGAQTIVEVPPLRTFTADPVTFDVQAGLLPAYVLPTVTRGGVDIHLDDDVDYSIATAGVTATVETADGDPDKGLIEITAIDALTGWIDVTVTVAGATYPAKRIAIEKRAAGSEAPGGSGEAEASWTSFSTLNATSYTAITTTKTVTVAGGETLHGTAPLDYWISNPLSIARTATAKWQYSPAGAGTWSDFDTEITGTAATGGSDPIAGSVSVAQDKGGLSAGDYDVRLVAKLDAASVNVSFVGTATIQVS